MLTVRMRSCRDTGWWWVLWIMLLVCIEVLTSNTGRQTRQAGSCTKKNPLPVLSKSKMCRCLHRPDWQDPSTTNFTTTPPGIYLLDSVPIDYVTFNPTIFPQLENSVCVYFGHGGPTLPTGHETLEFAIQAVNEHGWPTGRWSVPEYKTMCVSPTYLVRDKIFNDSLYEIRNCYHEDEYAGNAEGWYTEGFLNDSSYPNILHFHSRILGTFGFTALVKLETMDLVRRPKQLMFLVEAPFSPSVGSTTTPMLRIESSVYDVQYTTPGQILLAPSTSSILLNLDYIYEVRTKNQPAPTDPCLEPPPPPPPIPEFKEHGCRCMLHPRQPVLNQRIQNSPKQSTVHPRLNLSDTVLEFNNTNSSAPSLLPKEVEDFFTMYGNIHIYYPTNPAFQYMLVILYTFLPVYKARSFREREFMIGDFRYDTGRPVGRFLNPYNQWEENDYMNACDEAAGNIGIPNIKWTRPPFPAVGNCHPPDKSITKPTLQPCYFHFHSDYFYIECVETCDKPKYVCAVWTYGNPKTGGPNSTVPFEFQFISTSVYYENQDVSVGNIQLPSGSIGCGTSSSLKEWNVLETHLFNTAYYKRSDVWQFNPTAVQKFKFFGPSNYHTMTILDPKYVNETLKFTAKPNPSSKQEVDDCVKPATYYLEVKDNNLCLCTFWGENILTWQTHYGRQTSCSWAANTQSFYHHFKIDFHSREKDNVKVRVFADLSPPYTDLLKKYFVLHAIYIQGIDQSGIPVGQWHNGHWVDITSLADPKCPHDQFPPSSSAVAARYPIFDVKDCPSPPSFYRTANIFLYQNRWKDEFPIVCAHYTFKSHQHPLTKKIQFLAFVRIEDKFDDGHAYMVELRSDFIDARDLSAGPPTPLTRGAEEDKVMAYPPLNYEYYRKSLEPNLVHWDRFCLEPVRDPEKLFTVCRHYITTPYIKDEITNRMDLDGIIDQYNHVCGHWLTAYKRFGPSHPYTVNLLDKMKNTLESHRNTAIQVKNCFSLQAFRSRRKNAWHVRFRVSGTDPLCDDFRIPYLREAAMVAYNENGFPTGRPGGSIDKGGSFELYNHYETQDKKKHEHCLDDDIQLTLDDVIDNDKMAFHSEKAKCLYQDNLLTTAYQTDPSLFHQDWSVNSVQVIPSMMIWGNFKRLYDGFCAIWFYPKITQPTVTPPKYIQFVLEAQIQHNGINPKPPSFNDVDRIYTVRSPKYKFTYDPTMVKNLKPGTTIPDLVEDATDPANNDNSITNKCHDDELPIEVKKRPDDTCVCEIRPVPAPGTPPPPPGQAPLCIYKYEFYNHVFDNRLYRVCLLQEKARYGPESFPDDDCRTKLEYPRPPEIFPNEQITLKGEAQVDYNNTIVLEPFDPTDEVFYGCGLIKKCISRFENDKIERECIADRSCDMVVTFGKGLGEAHHPKDEVTMEIYAVSRGWAAVGISPQDEEMGDDYVVECAKEGGEVNLYNSWNVKEPAKTNYRMRGEQGVYYYPNKAVVRPVKSIFYEDKLYCKFYIKKKFTRIDPVNKKKHEYDLDDLYYYITAFSHALTDPYGENEGNLRTHVFNGRASRKGKQKFAGGERLSPLPHEARKFRLHALFMILAWMFFLTLSIFVARYFKETLVTTKILKMDFWYFTHVVTGTLALISLAIGIMFELSAKGGWRSLFRSNFHTYSGIVAFCFFVSEIVIGLVMKRTVETKRPLINWVHTVMGHIAYNLAIFNMAFSDRVAYGFLSCNFTTYCFIWLLVYYLLHAFMSYHYCWVDYILGRSLLSRQNTAFNVLTQAPNIQADAASGIEKSRFSLRRSRKLADLEAQRKGIAKAHKNKITEVPGRYVRLVALITFTVITSVYTFWAIRKIVSYPVFCYDFYQLKDLEEHGFN